jgi:hypothetical protein
MTAQQAGSSLIYVGGQVHKERFLAVAAKTTYFLNVQSAAVGVSSIVLQGSAAKTVIRLVSAYL